MDFTLPFNHNHEGMMLAIIIFSAGLGIGAVFVQVSSILNRKASDAVTSLITWALLLMFSTASTYYLWETSEFLVLPAMIGALALSTAIGLVVSIRARTTLAEVEAARHQQSNEELQQTADVLRAAFRLKKRVREARQQRA